MQRQAIQDNMGRTLNDAPKECMTPAGFLKSKKENNKGNKAEVFSPGVFIDESYKAFIKTSCTKTGYPTLLALTKALLTLW